MKAQDVRDCLGSRYPADQYLVVEEAPESQDRGGRRIDALVIGLWKSRGLEREAVEVKVSYSDWKRERDNHEKADFWWRHCHRLWIAAPAKLAARIAPELPETWGLLACDGGKATVAVEAARHEPDDLPWPTLVGVLRAASGVTGKVLQHERMKVAEEFHASTQRQIEQEVASRTARYEQMIEDFREASGIDLSNPYSGRHIGAAVALVLQEVERPGFLASKLQRPAENLSYNIDRLKESAEAVASMAEKVAAELQS